MIKHFICFINNIKHFDSKFIYHSDHFQKISDILSCMPEFREKRDSVDINHLFEIEQSEFIFEITKVIVSHNIEFYIKFHDQTFRFKIYLSF